jgi:hypothetical protein
MKPVVEKRLPAARLRLRETHLTTVMLKDLCHRDPDLRIKLVGQTRDEQRNVKLFRRSRRH